MNSTSPTSFISGLIRDRLLTDTVSWRQIVRDFEDDLNYLSLSLASTSGEVHAMATIEFGVQDNDKRHAAGILLARWRRAERVLGPVEMVSLDSSPVDPAAFVARLMGYLALEQTAEEIA